MKIAESEPVQPSSGDQPAHPLRAANPNFVQTIVCAVLGALILFCVWHWNYNLLGDFYDYSILASSGGYLHHGLKPYRDFTTSLQSLPIYLSYSSELLFGPRYLSMAYANLIFGLAFYAATLCSLKNRLPLLLRVLTALALAIAIFFQHGILWYNSLAMMLLALIVWQSAIIGRQRGLKIGQLVVLCLLLFLSSMAKVNFHFLGFAFCVAALAYSFLRSNPRERRQFLFAPPLIFLSAFVLGPTVEILLNGVTLHDFIYNVLQTPSDRMHEMLPLLLSPKLYFYSAHDFYPNNYSAGIYLTGAMIYFICAFAMFSPSATALAKVEDHNITSNLRRLIPLVLAGQFICSLFLTASNHEIQLLTASYLVIGLIAVYIIFADLLADAQSRYFRMAIFLLSAIFLITGVATSYRHSRLRFLESDSDASHGTASVNPGLTGYFEGVRLTQTASSRLSRITTFMEKNNLTNTPEKVYWGPGLETLNRVYGTCPIGGFPLWYHLHVSVNESDAPRIVAALEKNHYEWMVASVYYTKEMPAGVRDYFHENFSLADNADMGEDLVILHRKH